MKIRRARKSAAVMVDLAPLFSLHEVYDKVRRTADDRVDEVGEREGDRIGQCRADGCEEEGIASEEHIVGAENNVGGVGEYRHYVRGNNRKEAIPHVFGVVKAVIARGHKHEGAEDDSSVIEEGLEAGEGYRRVVAEYGGGIDEVYKSAEKTEGADVAARRISDASSAPDDEGHSVHPYAAGVDGETASDLKAEFPPEALPDELRRLGDGK